MRLRIEISPKTAFATPLLGETLFGQFCWEYRLRYGEKKLETILRPYTNNRPFAVISDAFPHNYVPIPLLPNCYWREDASTDRKRLKSRKWINPDLLSSVSIEQWREVALSNKELIEKLFLTKDATANRSANEDLVLDIPHAHNSISRLLSVTGTSEAFAPYSVSEQWFHPDLTWDIYIQFDEELLTREELIDCLKDIGLTGYGADASSGLGKFEIISDVTLETPKSKYCMTLASSVPNKNIVSKTSFWKTKTHFGRHGSMLAMGKPFKKPVLLATGSSVFSFDIEQNTGFIGTAVVGVSDVQPKAVHQGYAPYIALPSLEIKGVEL